MIDYSSSLATCYCLTFETHDFFLTSIEFLLLRLLAAAIVVVYDGNGDGVAFLRSFLYILYSFCRVVVNHKRKSVKDAVGHKACCTEDMKYGVLTTLSS